jgi:hypothetical protein
MRGFERPNALGDVLEPKPFQQAATNHCVFENKRPPVMITGGRFSYSIALNRN